MATKTPNVPIHKKRRYQEPPHETHICNLILLFLLVTVPIDKMKLKNFKRPKYMYPAEIETKQKTLQISTFHIAMKLKVPRREKLLKTPAHLISVTALLILLANDVHQNPGPNHPNPIDSDNQCIICKNPARNETAFKCDTCSQWSHLTCTGRNNSPQTSFEWICLNSNCSPNHVEPTITTRENQLISPNRYRLIERDRNLENLNTPRRRSPNIARRSSPKKKCNKEVTNEENENSLLLNELPKILPQDYEGKDLCRSCYKEVKQSQQAICCDTCQKWIHRSCSDMNVSRYNQCKKLEYFQWICNKCRCDEVVITDKVDLTVLKPWQLPEELSGIKALKKELVIIHLNCRSILNKPEELDHIIQETDADIIALTETWMDSSVPQQAHVPEGYCIIRKDRS